MQLDLFVWRLRRSIVSNRTHVRRAIDRESLIEFLYLTKNKRALLVDTEGALGATENWVPRALLVDTEGYCWVLFGRVHGLLVTCYFGVL